MEYATVRLVFDRKHLASKDTKGLVQIEVRYQGKRKFIGTGVKLYADEWKDKYHVVNNFNAIDLNRKLASQVSAIEGFISSLISSDEAFSFEKLDAFLRKPHKEQSFLDFVNDRIVERGDIAESTKKVHRVLLSALDAFGEIKSFSDLTKANIVRFDDWLHSHDYKQTTVWGYHKRMKAYINEAIRFELLDANPYATLKFSRGKSEGIKYLMQDEVKQIERADMPNEHLERVRDLFVFQCYTGLSYSDLAKFRWEDVRKEGDNYIIEDARQKTEEKYVIVLLRPALRVLQKYNYQLPSLSNQKYNDFLKSVAAIAGIHKPVTSHWARHTFAVMALSAGAKMQNVSRMLGHASMTITESTYAKVLAKDVKKDYALINSQIE